MSTATEVFSVPDVSRELKRFSVSDSAIAKMAEDYLPLKINGVDDANGLKTVHKARMVVKGLRVEVEKTRKFLKEDSVKYGRAVDAEARRITALLEPIESHLEREEEAVVIAKERARKAEEEAARAKAEAEAKAIRDAEEARIRAQREAEEARLKAEREKLDAERAAMKAEQDRLDSIRREQQAEAAKLEAERRRIADEESARQRAIEMEKAKAEAAENARIETEKRIAREAKEAEERKAEQERRAAAEAARIEEMRPDIDKVRGFGMALCAMDFPEVKSETGVAFMERVKSELLAIGNRCRSFSAM